MLPVVRPGGSDSATFDNVLELLVLAGRSLPHAIMMMVPEAWEGRDDLPEHLKAFYAFHSCVMEPWDGPAAVAFTDGRVIGATLDRNGLRPGRWMETRDGWVVLGSETGVLDEPPENILRKGRLQPGKLFLVDLAEGRIVADEEVKEAVTTRRPYGEWYSEGVVRLDELEPRRPIVAREPLRTRQLAFGYTQEDLRVLLAPMAAKGEEPIGSMGNDLALAVLSDQAPPLFAYFKQLFAQVTNPPIDPIRESRRDVHPHGGRLGAQPARGERRARPSARASRTPSSPTSSWSRCAGSTPPSSARTTCPSPGRWPRARRAWRAPCGASASRRRRRSPSGPTSSSCPTAASGPSGPRSPRCWPWRPSTTTSCGRARACRPASCSSPASRARSTTSRR